MLKTFAKVTNLSKFSISVSLQSGKRMAQNYSTSFEPTFFTKSGGKISQDDFLENLSKFAGKVKEKGGKGVVLVGENHMDPSAHQLELKILEKVSAAAKNENLKVSISQNVFSPSLLTLEQKS
jgi:hypothetical protein